MKLKINKTSIEIPTADNLTCRQYLECLEASKSNDPFILRYLSIVTGFNYVDVCNANIDFTTIQRLIAWIGQIKNFDYFLINQNTQVYIKGNLFVSTRKDFDFEKVGVSILFQAKAERTESREVLAIYLLAILLTPDFDADKTEAKYEQLLEENYIKILSFSTFFLSKYLKYSKTKKKHLIQRAMERIKNITLK